MLTVKYCSGTAIGGRDENQDSLLTQEFSSTICGPEFCFGVFDGLGGEANGRLASAAVAASLAENNLYRSFPTSGRYLNDAAMRVGGMTTASAMSILLSNTEDSDYIVYFHTGDSAIFFLPFGETNPIRITKEMNAFGAWLSPSRPIPPKHLKNMLADACLGQRRFVAQTDFPFIKDPRGTWIAATDGFIHAFENSDGTLTPDRMVRMFELADEFYSLEAQDEREDWLQQLSDSTDENDNATLVVVKIS